MTEGQATMALPRNYGHVRRDLNAAHDEYWLYVKLAAQHRALDNRPMFYDQTTHTVSRLGEFVLPTDLQNALTDAADRVRALQHELWNARR